MTYKGQPVLDIAPDFTSLRSGVNDDSSFESSPAGVGTPWKATDGPRRTVTYPFSLTSRERIAEFRRFIASRYGRLYGFWLPVYLLDYELVSITGTEVVIRHVGLADAVSEFGQFQQMVFYYGDVLQIAQIASIESDGDSETITLTAELGTAVEPSETLCGGAMFVRCQSDSVSYNFRGLEFAQTEVRFIEIPREYPSGTGGGGGDDDEELENEIVDSDDPGVTPPGEGGEIVEIVSEYKWFLGAEADPNAIVTDPWLSVYKALFINERELAITGGGYNVTSYGEWYWYWHDGSDYKRNAYHKTDFPSTDPESTDGDAWNFTSIGWWALAQRARYTP